MNADTYIIAQLASYSIQQGARFGGVANMFAVAHVMRNRVEQGWFGGDWMQVLEAARDSEAVDYSAEPVSVNLKNYAMRGFLQGVDDVYTGDRTDIFSGGKGVYFADLSDQRIAAWFRQRILERPDEHPRVGSIQLVTLFG